MPINPRAILWLDCNNPKMLLHRPTNTHPEQSSPPGLSKSTDLEIPSLIETQSSSLEDDQSPEDEQIPIATIEIISPGERAEATTKDGEDTSEEEVEYAEESVQIMGDDEDLSDDVMGIVPVARKPVKKYEVPTDPKEYEAALLEAIEAERKVAHLSGKEFELTFNIQYTTKVRLSQPGEKLFVTGGHEFLGSWNQSSALEMEWSPGHNWKLTITLAEGAMPAFDYKFLCVSPWGTRWEGGNNRRFQPEHYSALRGPKVVYNLVSSWQL